MADSKDKKISEVPHLEDVTGVEKIPVSAAGGQPRYVEVKQIVDKAVDSIEPISLEYIDILFYPTPPGLQVNNDLWLIDYGSSLMNVIKAVRAITELGLSESRNLVESAPCLIKHFNTYKEVLEAKQTIDNCGNDVITEIR